MNWSLLYPEIAVAISACLILILDLFLPKENKKITYILSLATLLGAMFLTLQLTQLPTTSLFNNAFIMDNIGNLLKWMAYAVTGYVLMYSQEYLIKRDLYRGEYFVLTLFSLLGLMVLVSAGNFLTLYLGIELVTLPLFALIAFAKEHKLAQEAAMKYFVMGAMASGMLLYGISLLYGTSGSFEFLKVSTFLTLQAENPPLVLLVGMVLVLVGLCFKLGAVPFHMWIPDVYQGAPTSVTLFIGTLPKLAGFGLALRLFLDAFPTFLQYWQPLLLLIALASIVMGNVIAIVQTNLKRLLGYSAMSHIGFLFLGLLAGPEAGYTAAFVYVFIYVLMVLGAFGIMLSLNRGNLVVENLNDFRGLGTKEPWIALMLLLVMLSMAGVPPLAGFYGKLLVLNALIQAGYIGSAVITVLFTVIGAYYSLKVIRALYFELPIEPNPSFPVANRERVLMSLNGALIVILGIFPAPLYELCLAALIKS
jgi:NADH-quinone oxidoreductase subunit N